MSRLQGPQQPADVAFVTINYNTKALLEQLVAFLVDAAVPFSYSITVVDNNSTDGSLETIENNPRVQIIRNAHNVGYGRAANMGVRASRGAYVCVLNTDVILNERALTAMWRYMEENRAVGSCSPVVRYDNGKIQGFTFSFSRYINAFDVIARLHGKLQKMLIPITQKPMPVDGVKGALLFLRRAYIEDDTLFDEDFFFYFEDTDLAYRWYRKGYASAILPTESIIHLGGQSSGGIMSTQYYLSATTYITKHQGESAAARYRKRYVGQISRKIAVYRLISCFWPSKTVKWKLKRYSDSLRTLSEAS